MILSIQAKIYIILLCCIGLSDAASVNVTLSSQNVQNGSSLTLSAEFDPAPGEVAFIDLQCGADKRLTAYNHFLKKMTINSGLSPNDSARLNVTSSGNTMVLVISPIKFHDEKKTFNCILFYYNSVGNKLTITSRQHRLENVYSPPAFLHSMMPTTLLAVGHIAYLYCSAIGRPAPTIVWQYNSSINAENTTYVWGSTLSTVSSYFIIRYVTQLLDGQTIACVVTHPFALPITRNTTILVPYAPVFLSMSSVPQKVYSGSSSSISCKARGSPTPSYRFYSNNGTLLQNSSSAFYISTLRYEDYADYKATFACVPYNRLGEGRAQYVTVGILVLPRLSVSVLPSAVNETQNATISCVVVAANPSANITLRDLFNETIAHAQGNLVLRNLTRDDAGRYSCAAENGLIGSPVIETAYLTVNHAPDQVELKASSLVPENGSTITLTCSARGAPRPLRYRFSNVKGSSQTTLRDGSSQAYTITMIDYKNFYGYKAVFACASYNSFGMGSSRKVTLDIQVRPQINTASAYTALEGQSVALHCSIMAANPTPNLIWMSPTLSTIPNINGTIALPLVKRNQQGEYTCQASNRVGSVERKTFLTVNYGPEIIQANEEYEKCIGESIEVHCRAAGQPLPEILLYHNKGLLARNSSSLTFRIQVNSSTDFGVYTCVSQNAIGVANITTTLKTKRSGNVSNIKLMVKDNSVRVTWDLPQCSSSIKEIKVQYKKIEQCSWKWELTAKFPWKEATIKELEAPSEFEVRVVVVDISGNQHIAEAPATARIGSKKSGESSTAPEKTALYTVVPLLILMLVLLLSWIFKQRREIAALSMENRCTPQRCENQTTYMDLQLQNMHTDTQHRTDTQYYANLESSGAVANNQVPERDQNYMGLISNRAQDQLYCNLRKENKML